ncbi:MAG: radical SAM protein, partial [Oligoflexia bacterium]|nr:radical SAM protein [Oligoflexia bacterium]
MGLQLLKKIVKLVYRVALSNLGRLRSPYKLTYVVTKRCGSRCVNCAVWREGEKRELSLQEVRSLARRSPFLSWIDFTGGEPTDRPDFSALVGAFLEECPDLLLIHFPTNGLDPSRIERSLREIASHPRAFGRTWIVVSVSIDGPPSVNDRLRGVKGGFERAVETYGRISRLKGVRAYVGMTLYPENVGLIDQTVEEIRRRVPGFAHRDLHLNIPNISPHFYGNQHPARGRVTSEQLQGEFARRAAIALREFSGRGVPLSPFEIVERIYQ